MSLHNIIGVMSGTSMDGVDVAMCSFESGPDDNYAFTIQAAHTFQYPVELKNQLAQSKTLSTEGIFKLDRDLGDFFGRCILEFVETYRIQKENIHTIASHGHTVFHRPELGYTVQIGCGTSMAQQTGIPVINDFRTKDVVFGGQGAPLVPIGDQLLFRDLTDGFLNIGGFVNISIPAKTVQAFDICPGNLPLNLQVNRIGMHYDAGGELARSGSCSELHLNQLNNLPFYKKSAPKSLGTEWLESEFLPILEGIPEIKDRLHTCTLHIAQQIARVCKTYKLESLYITGGGAFNSFLIDEIKAQGIYVIIPDDQTVNFKEALVFAFLGLRFLEGKYNCLASVTGATQNVCGGTLHTPH